MTTKSDVYQMGLILHLMATWRHLPCGSDPALIELPAEAQSVVGLLSFIVWYLQVEPNDRADCDTDLEHGCLPAVEMLEQRRDALFKRDGALDRRLWSAIEFG
ncbi:uncharacterized protein LTR77_007068 [Saxophila tyrrhenica]|uniref:Protein kinase domain-containing protein n=1 Tax=Saxophila tyrrhenica TaxID=1690608 RepID=A0AAV9P3I9_9PEZI|nr:hypothetical protein LTR77_007068 [Saxophila tyrrhenica]